MAFLLPAGQGATASDLHCRPHCHREIQPVTSDAQGAARPLIRDPRAIPTVGTDAHLPAVPPQRLSEAGLRQALAQAHLKSPAIPGDGAWPGGAPRAPAPASVLVPLVWREGQAHVLLTRRTAHLRDHAGQISFPGGRQEPEDADAVQTALREAHEEVGLAPQQVEVVGQLAPYTTVTRFVVTPVLGFVRGEPRLQLDAFEVAEAFEVPLAHLMNPAHHRLHRAEFQGQTRSFLSMPWGPADRYFIWGATAAMLRNLYHVLMADTADHEAHQDRFRAEP